ncbi:MAG: prepilin-type N-terminal cleavage/methylation domain-containing protein [Candidatus Doudnabacteria bacterium]|nr:prepilin-type N-terminal cleavage/methylation domain-containing protein [Candidatus Doudnabacteria bacterium]
MKNQQNKQTRLESGFSLIELLVVIAIIATLASIVSLSVQSARQKSRDAKRAADIKQLASALENYFTTNNAYPVQTIAATTIPGLDINYIGQIPVAPIPEEPNCVGQNDYIYESDGLVYTTVFCLGDTTGDYTPGVHYLTPQGVQ